MTEQLHSMKCEACRADAPRVSDAELAVLIREIPDWTPIADQGILKLQRVFSFTDFAGAMTFANHVSNLAEENGHHPAILVEWGKVTVTWWTNKINGLHKTDFIMAAKTDLLPRA